MKFQRNLPAILGTAAAFLLVCAPAAVQAQPQTPLTGLNKPCSAGPILVGGAPDTLNLPTDDSGFVSIFDGTSLKGWWEGCGSSHSDNDKTNGGIWLVDSNSHVLFANQNTNGAGSILMTNKSYLNYELQFEVWPSFGDDGGVFNRVTAAGSCYQSTIDYVQASSIGGVYFEGGYDGGVSRNIDPYVFAANKATITIGTNSNSGNRLDSITKRFANPVDFGCPATGCGPANWTAIWDTGGWNQMRVQFFGTGGSAANKVHNFASIRKLGSTKWIPTVRDSVQFNTPAAPLGFQIHGGTGSWSNRNGDWYRNIKIRPLTDQGVPIIVPSAVRAATGAVGHHEVRAVGGTLTGTIDADYRVTVRDARGKTLESFSGRAGAFSHVLENPAQGLLFVQIKTAQGAAVLRVPRVFE